MSTANMEYDYEEKFQEALKGVTSNSLKQKLVAIKNLVVKRLALEREFKANHYKLEAKYEELYRPIYQKRFQVIEGTQEVTVDDIKEELKNLTLTDVNAVESEKGIPSFWLKCLKNCSQFSQEITEKDEKVLASLRDIQCDFKDNGSFTLHFHFYPNPYFDANVLSREFLLDPEKLTISKIISSKIEWKSDDLNPTVEKKKKKLKSKKETKIVTKLEEVASFFNFFKDYDVTNAKKEKDEDPEEEEEDEMDLIEEEYDLGLFIKEELIPYAIEYYLGIIKEDDMQDFADEEDEEDEEMSDESDHGKHKRKGKH